MQAFTSGNIAAGKMLLPLSGRSSHPDWSWSIGAPRLLLTKRKALAANCPRARCSRDRKTDRACRATKERRPPEEPADAGDFWGNEFRPAARSREIVTESRRHAPL